MASAVGVLFTGLVAMPFAFFLSGFLWLIGLGLLGVWMHRGTIGRRYSLSALREVDEREAAQRLAAETGRPEGGDTILCSGCFESYSAAMPCCPRCGR